MSKMTVEDTSLTAVADAIREKGGTTDPLVFPDGFVDAIGNISSGGTTNILTPLADRSITEITADMLAGCKSIGKYAFSDCSNLASIVIPESVTVIGGSSFSYCTRLTTIEMKSTTPPAVQANSFKSCSALTTVIVPKGTLATYQTATNWSAYADLMVEAEG